jgi:hypothetical protein
MSIICAQSIRLSDADRARTRLSVVYTTRTQRFFAAERAAASSTA